MTRRGFLRFFAGFLSWLGLKGKLKLIFKARGVSFKEAQFYRRVKP